MTTAPLRAAIYARYSSDMQRAASIEDQIRICRERAEASGWEIVGTYEDRAISGTTMIRPGIQRLQADARDRRFDIVLVEAMDRLSRSQADIAAIYRNISYAGVAIETLSEGRIDELHVGLKGTMNQLFIKDLAAKTRRGLRGRVEAGKSGGGNAFGYRGLRGRVEAGKSGGGNAFGYRVLRPIGEDGEIRRGEREIDQEQATVVRRIFEAYCDGQSPGRIADMLNREGVLGPRGGAWDKSAIHGNPRRGTGVLNNEMYVGRRVWARQTFVTDPQTGKRQARPNPEDKVITTEVPELRIIPDDLWKKVKARQEDRKIEHTEVEAWERRAPRFLLTGLMKCGCCGGGFSTVAKDRFGCSNARNKGKSYCQNITTVTRADMEGRILAALSTRLMDPELPRAFAEEYIAERNRLAASHVDDRAVKERELAKVVRDQDTLVNALLAGTPAERIRDRMSQLETRQKQLEAELAAAKPSPSPTRLHPRMAETYHTRITALIAGLTEPAREGEAKNAIRGLIDRIIVTPEPGPGSKRMIPRIDLQGSLAAILALSLGADRVSGQQKTACEGAVVQSVVFDGCGSRI